MGGETFSVRSEGADADQAFAAAVREACYESGHGGYTGTIAEKDSFVMIEPKPMPRAEAAALARKLIDDDDPRIDDKWGPAGCIALDDGSFLFFGWASS